MFSPATCLPDNCFCEVIRPEGLMQPINAYSSLFLLVMALVILWNARGRGWFGYAYAGALAFVGLGSFWYHADLTLLTQAFDNLGMYFVILLPITLLASRRYNFSGLRIASLFIFLSSVSLAIILIYPEARRYEFIFLILILLFLEYLWSGALGIKNRAYLYFGLGIFVVSGIIWVLDITGVWCMSLSIWQGHAVWHILNGLSSYMLYLHYRKIN